MLNVSRCWRLQTAAVFRSLRFGGKEFLPVYVLHSKLNLWRREEDSITVLNRTLKRLSEIMKIEVRDDPVSTLSGEHSDKPIVCFSAHNNAIAIIWIKTPVLTNTRLTLLYIPLAYFSFFHFVFFIIFWNCYSTERCKKKLRLFCREQFLKL